MFKLIFFERAPRGSANIANTRQYWSIWLANIENENYAGLTLRDGSGWSRIKGTFGWYGADLHICSICAYFSVARFVISGGYYHSSFESVIKSIVRWASIWGSRFGFAQCVIDVGGRFEWAPLYHQASIATPYFSVVMEPPRPTPSAINAFYTFAHLP